MSNGRKGLEDARFKHFQSNSLFGGSKNMDEKVVTDERFAAALTDERFSSRAKVDMRGRKTKKSTGNDMLDLYEVEADEKKKKKDDVGDFFYEEDDNAEEVYGGDDEKEESSEDDDDDDVETTAKRNFDFARGEGSLSSSSDDYYSEYKETVSTDYYDVELLDYTSTTPRDDSPEPPQQKEETPNEPETKRRLEATTEPCREPQPAKRRRTDDTTKTNLRRQEETLRSRQHARRGPEANRRPLAERLQSTQDNRLIDENRRLRRDEENARKEIRHLRATIDQLEHELREERKTRNADIQACFAIQKNIQGNISEISRKMDILIAVAPPPPGPIAPQRTAKTASALITHRKLNDFPSTNECAFCSGHHYSDTCSTITNPWQRGSILVQRKRCTTCLAPYSSHVSENLNQTCPAKKRCKYCGQNNHHCSICPTFSVVPIFT